MMVGWKLSYMCSNGTLAVSDVVNIHLLESEERCLEVFKTIQGSLAEGISMSHGIVTSPEGGTKALFVQEGPAGDAVRRKFPEWFELGDHRRRQ